MSGLSKQQFFELLQEVKDPEVPVISVVELGVVRDVELRDGAVHVKLTPTYSGCPAIKVMENDIVACLNSHGYENVTVEIVFAPAWTTDWMSDEAKLKLKEYGIAPPGKTSDEALISIGETKPIECPQCNSSNTIKKSEFGATACKSLHYCNNCEQPFEHFKTF